MNGPGVSVTKISKRYGTDLPPTEKVLKHTDKSIWHRYSGKPPNGKMNKFEANRSGDYVEDKKLVIASNKRAGAASSSNDKLSSRSESDPYDSVGGTLSDGIKSMKMFPILNSYQEIDAANRSYLWKVYLEGLGGKYVIIDKKPTGPDDLDESETPSNIIRKVEISTLIKSDSEIYSTKLDLENQSVVSLDVDRTRNP